MDPKDDVRQALLHANNALQQEIERISKNGDLEELNSLSDFWQTDQAANNLARGLDNSGDPDDLAAAFFAQQAAAKQYERTLPVQEWARAIASKVHSESTVTAGASGNPPMVASSANDGYCTSSLFKDQVDELLMVFLDALDADVNG